MGLGGYLAARSDAEHYASERDREHKEVREKPAVEAREVADIFRAYGLSDEETRPILRAFESRPQQWIDFMMRFELGLEKPDPRRALRSAMTIGGAYAVGGLIPLAPYILLHDVAASLWVSVVLDAPRPGGLRVREGALHGGAALEERDADDAHRRRGGGRGVRDRPGRGELTVGRASPMIP